MEATNIKKINKLQFLERYAQDLDDYKLLLSWAETEEVVEYTQDYLDQMKQKMKRKDPGEILIFEEEVDSIMRRRKEILGNSEMITKDNPRRESQDDKPKMVKSKTSNRKDINSNANMQRIRNENVHKKSLPQVKKCNDMN